jgi:hypothetical protein
MGDDPFTLMGSPGRSFINARTTTLRTASTDTTQNTERQAPAYSPSPRSRPWDTKGTNSQTSAVRLALRGLALPVELNVCCHSQLHFSTAFGAANQFAERHPDHSEGNSARTL